MISAQVLSVEHAYLCAYSETFPNLFHWMCIMFKKRYFYEPYAFHNTCDSV